MDDDFIFGTNIFLVNWGMDPFPLPYSNLILKKWGIAGEQMEITRKTSGKRIYPIKAKKQN